MTNAHTEPVTLGQAQAYIDKYDLAGSGLAIFAQYTNADENSPVIDTTPGVSTRGGVSFYSIIRRTGDVIYVGSGLTSQLLRDAIEKFHADDTFIEALRSTDIFYGNVLDDTYREQTTLEWSDKRQRGRELIQKLQDNESWNIDTPNQPTALIDEQGEI